MQSDFRGLKIWQASMDLAKLIYALTSKFPDSERYGLTSQMRRCAVSIPSNIAEGSGRGTDAQFCQFLGISQGSAFELETQVLLAERMNLVTTDDIKEIIELLHYVQKMNYKLKESLSKNKS